jgi:hypothetical protein
LNTLAADCSGMVEIHLGMQNTQICTDVHLTFSPIGMYKLQKSTLQTTNGGPLGKVSLGDTNIYTYVHTILTVTMIYLRKSLRYSAKIQFCQ